MALVRPVRACLSLCGPAQALTPVALSAALATEPLQTAALWCWVSHVPQRCSAGRCAGHVPSTLRCLACHVPRCCGFGHAMSLKHLGCAPPQVQADGVMLATPTGSTAYRYSPYTLSLTPRIPITHSQQQCSCSPVPKPRIRPFADHNATGETCTSPCN